MKIKKYITVLVSFIGTLYVINSSAYNIMAGSDNRAEGFGKIKLVCPKGTIKGPIQKGVSNSYTENANKLLEPNKENICSFYGGKKLLVKAHLNYDGKYVTIKLLNYFAGVKPCPGYVVTDGCRLPPRKTIVFYTGSTEEYPCICPVTLSS